MPGSAKKRQEIRNQWDKQIMKRTNPTMTAHLIRGALLLIAACSAPFALGQFPQMVLYDRYHNDLKDSIVSEIRSYTPVAVNRPTCRGLLRLHHHAYYSSDAQRRNLLVSVVGTIAGFDFYGRGAALRRMVLPQPGEARWIVTAPAAPMGPGYKTASAFPNLTRCSGWPATL